MIRMSHHEACGICHASVCKHTALTLDPHCSKVRVEGTDNGNQWYACTRTPKHSGRCKMVPVAPTPAASGEPAPGEGST